MTEKPRKTMDRKLLLEYVRVTEAAAIACSRLIGAGKKDAARKLQEAADAIRDRKLRDKIR